jgi:hypothetical protein
VATVIKRGVSPGDVYELLNWDVLHTESTQGPDGKLAPNTTSRESPSRELTHTPSAFA